jgi:LuxR family transcriptional regulator, maltose regulon positive regulatory protein
MSTIPSRGVAPEDQQPVPTLAPRPVLLETNLRVPTRLFDVHRWRVLERLRDAHDARIVSLAAPAGYGKTTVMAQLASGLPGRVAWITVDEGADDATALLAYVAAALGRVESVPPSVLDRLGTAGTPLRDVMAELLGALAAHTEPVLVVIDDVHRLQDPAALQVLTSLVEHLPSRFRVMLAGRDVPALPFARWLAEEVVLRLGPADLAMTDAEATHLLVRRGPGLAPEEVRRLVTTMRGWPALLALAIADANRTDRDARHPERPLPPSVVDYLRSEVIAPLPAGDAELLLGSSILERLSGSECDAVLERRASGRILVRLSRAALLEDEGGGWFRLHPVLRDHFQAELLLHEPERIPGRHRRAAVWLEARGSVDDAVAHAFASGDIDLAAAIIGRAIVPHHWAARRASARGWLQRFDDEAFATRPWLALDGAWQALSAGDLARAEHLADIAELGAFEGAPPDGTPSFEMGRAMLRAAMCRLGPEDALEHALRAVMLDRPGSEWRGLALWTVALARQALGDVAGADAALGLAVSSAHANRNVGLGGSLLGHRALLAVDRGDWVAGEGFLDEARGLAGSTATEGDASTAPTLAATARIEARRGNLTEATAILHGALLVRPSLTAAAPVLSVISIIGLARAHLAVGDAPGAGVLLAHGRLIVRVRPRLGVLGAELASLQSSIEAMPPLLARGASSLTPAELRVLALLPFYLSFKEIGQRLGIKATTVKTQAQSIYGKLGASTRSEAVELAVDAGLLDRLP